MRLSDMLALAAMAAMATENPLSYKLTIYSNDTDGNVLYSYRGNSESKCWDVLKNWRTHVEHTPDAFFEIEEYFPDRIHVLAQGFVNLVEFKDA